MDQVRPAYYGGPSNPYEPIKVIEAWDLDFKLGNCVKYIARYKKKSKKTLLLDLKKAATYLDMKIQELEGKNGVVTINTGVQLKGCTGVKLNGLININADPVKVKFEYQDISDTEY